jgi:hypothetical protein
MRKLFCIISIALLASCAIPLSQIPRPSPSADVVKMDENECAAKRLRLCIAEVWFYLKWKMNIMKGRDESPALRPHHDS